MPLEALAGGQDFELPYDDLIVAAGVRQSCFGHDERALGCSRHGSPAGDGGLAAFFLDYLVFGARINTPTEIGEAALGAPDAITS